MALAAEPFETVVIRNCPPEAPYYICVRLGGSGALMRFPIGRALKLNPFEWPTGAKPGAWMIQYTRDAQGEVVVPNGSAKAQVIATLSYPAEVCDPPEPPSDAELASMLASKEAEVLEDDEDGSLKATRIDAKKREIAIDLTAKEQKLARRAAVNKELSEGYLLNRSFRLEVRDQSEAMFRVQNQTLVMSERNLVLIEKIQESLGRIAEIEKEASRRVATPPAPIDYSPVLNGVVSAIRDIGVSALQRDHKTRPKSDDEARPVKAALTEKQADSEVSAIPASSAAAIPAEGSPAAVTPPTAPPSLAEILAALERTQAERDRFKSELEAERQRQLVLAELLPQAAKQAQPAVPAPADSSEPVPPPSRAKAEKPARPEEIMLAAEPANKIQPEKNSQPKDVAARGTDAKEPSQPPLFRAVAAEATPAAPAIRSAAASRAKDSLGTAAAPPSAPSARPLFTPRASRNAPCPCRSGRKYKKCCLLADQQAFAKGEQLAALESATPRNTSAAENTAKTAAEVPDVASATQAAAESVLAAQVEVSASASPSAELQELLVNTLAGRMLADPEKSIPRPVVNAVELLEEVMVAPSKLDPETANKLLKDGTALEAFGAFLFFNPAIRTMLLSLRGK